MKLKELFESSNERVDPSWERETGLPPEYLREYSELGNKQRDRPERVMVSIQQIIGGGVMSFLIEHVGDLTNRLTPLHPFNWAVDESLKKIDKTLNVLNSGYGVEREFYENLRSNAKLEGVDEEKFINEAERVLEQYASAHLMLNPRSSVHKISQRAAINLGELEFKECEKNLRLLKNILRNKQKFIEMLREPFE